MSAIKNRTYIIILMLFVAVYEGCLSWQGFSMLDEGWVMSAYQWIFKDPESVQYQMLYYNGLVVGGIWEKFFGQWGYLGFRICNILFLEYIAIIVYCILRDYANKWCIILGIFLSLLIYDTGIIVIHHNCITAAFVVTAVLLLQKALYRASIPYMVIAGTLIGVNVFTRLPNMSFCALIFILIPYYHFTKSGRQTLSLLAAAIAGFLIGIAIELLFIYSIGHWELFFENIASGLSASNAIDSTHRLGTMLPRYLDQYLYICKHIALFAILPLMLWLLNYKSWNNHHYINLLKWIFLISCFVVIIMKFEPPIIDVYAFLTMAIAYNIYESRQDEKIIYISILALLVAYLQPLGSDWGVSNMGDQSVFLAMPLAVSIAYRKKQSLVSNDRKLMSAYLILALVTLVVFYSRFIATHCDFDYGPRWEKTFRIDHPLATTYTQKSYADAVNELLPILSHYVKDGDYMLNYPGFSTIHYLTHTRSYIGNTWTWTYDSSNLARQLTKAEKSQKPLPVMLIGKCGTLSDFTQYDPDWNNCYAEETYGHHNNTIKVMQDFIKRNHYTIAWEDNLFQILIPGKNK